ncbi:MAG: hypothetical protein ACJ72J_04205 [Nitrososphaeraceae archaeon]
MSARITDIKEVLDFAEILRYVLELKIDELRTAMRKSNTHLECDMLKYRL